MTVLVQLDHGFTSLSQSPVPLICNSFESHHPPSDVATVVDDGATEYCTLVHMQRLTRTSTRTCPPYIRRGEVNIAASRLGEYCTVRVLVEYKWFYCNTPWGPSIWTRNRLCTRWLTSASAERRYAAPQHDADQTSQLSRWAGLDPVSTPDRASFIVSFELIVSTKLQYTLQSIHVERYSSNSRPTQKSTVRMSSNPSSTRGGRNRDAKLEKATLGRSCRPSGFIWTAISARELVTVTLDVPTLPPCSARTMLLC